MLSNKNEKKEKKATRTNRNVLLFLENKTYDYENRIALGIRTHHGWNEYTYKGISMLSKKIACYLINELKVKKGDRFAILSESRPEFGGAVFASAMAGMTTVPLDIKLTKYELQSILSSCKPTTIIVSHSYLKIAKELKQEIDSIKCIITFDDVDIEDNDGSIISLRNMPNEKEAKWRLRKQDSTALIIYTSGTTGAPKGVQTTFRNMLTQLDDLSFLYDTIFKRKKDIAILSILPMNHLFELTVGFSMLLSFGYSIYYTKSLKPKDILNLIQEKKIYFMIVVPAFLKLLKTSLEAQIKGQTKFRQRLHAIKMELAKYIPSYRLRKMMFKKLHENFGEKFYGFLSGGAPLDPATGEFFNRIGIRIYQGYGLSETSPVISMNTDKTTDVSSVGRPLKSYEAKVDKETGELIVRGPSVMKGYYEQPELTAEVMTEDGWLHTGDIAHIDKDNHLHITGRIKNMIVLSGGKKVFPEEVEEVLKQSENFLEVCVFGSSRTTGAKEGTEEIVAAIVPTEHFMSQAKDDEELNTIVRQEAKKYANRLAAYKRPVNIIVLKDPLPKTATNKVKRREVKALVNA